MQKPVLTAILILCLTVPAWGQPRVAREDTPKPVAEAESVRVKDDFAGSFIVTTDGDRKKKWDAPASAMPSFNKAGVVAYGRKVFVPTLFANPKHDAKGHANLRCDVKITNAAGKVQLSRANLACHAEPLVANKYGVHLSEPVITFFGDPGDPPGLCVVEVKLHDSNRAVANRAVANQAVERLLRISFELKAST